MKKYYIPTSSLNFNNILSSESISPKAFYSTRSFGYGRWASIPENPLENSIVLYDELCAFNRPQSTYEDHPLLIETVFDDVVESTLLNRGDHTFLCDHTIYIDPLSTRLIFFTDSDKRVALSMSDASIETKFVDIYKRKIVVVASPTKCYMPIEPIEIQQLNTAEIEKDKRINRMKGLLYGYYIGDILSAPKDYIIKLNKAREIQNILAAILSSVDHQATPQQRERLKALYAAFQPQVPLFYKLSSIIQDKTSFDKVVSVIREEYGYIPKEINVDRIIDQLLNTSTSLDAKNPIIDSVNAKIRQIEGAISKNAHSISIDDDQVVICNGSFKKLNIESISEKDQTLFKAWINDVLVRDEYNGKISSFKEALSDDITIKAKEICETVWNAEWKGSTPEITLNALRRHVRGSEYVHDWSNDIYSSISALLMRGDDWQKLLEYMQGKEMTDYRLAYAMYGTINGFANLPRDFTDVLLRQERNYIAEVVYKEFYGQLHGRGVVKPPKSEVDEVVSAVELEYKVASQSGESEEFSNIMADIVKKCKGAKKDEQRYKELYTQSGGSIQKFTDAVYNDGTLNRGKGAQKAIKEMLSRLMKSSKKEAVVEKNDTHIINATLFDEVHRSTGRFLDDFEFLANNQELCSIMINIKEDWKEELQWWLKDYINPESLYYGNSPKDNSTAIRKFVTFKNGRYKSVESLLRKIYNI